MKEILNQSKKGKDIPEPCIGTCAIRIYEKIPDKYLQDPPSASSLSELGKILK